MKNPTVTLLDSGYWHVRWSREIWAQWERGRVVRPDDFFHDTATPERLRFCERLSEAP